MKYQGLKVLAQNDRYGVKDRCLDFDGVGDYVEISPGISTMQYMSVEFWIKKSTSADDYFFFFGDSWSTAHIYFAIMGIAPRIRFWDFTNAQNSATSNITINDGNWHHCAFTINNKESKVYIDGVLRDTDTRTNDYSDGGVRKIWFATRASDTEFSNIDMDEVRIWDHVRTQDQIRRYKDVRLFGTETGLVAYYPMNEGSGDTVFDKSLNSNHGTIEGADWIYPNKSLLTQLYVDRVEDDDGEVINEQTVNKKYNFLDNEDIYDDLMLGISSNYGLKLREDGDDKFVEKAYDISDEDNDITQSTNNNQPELITDGFLGKNSENLRLSFTDNNDDFNGLDELTILCWVKFNDVDIVTEGNARIYGLIHNTTGNLVVSASNAIFELYYDKRENRNRITFLVTDYDEETETESSKAARIFNVPSEIGANNWVMMTGTFNASTTTQKIYLNTDVAQTNNNSADNLYAGELVEGPFVLNFCGGPRFSLDGVMNDVMIFNKELSSTEITDIYNHTKHKYE